MSHSFEDLFGAPAAVSSAAPGRVNLIGEHTDYNDGFVLPAVLPLETAVALRPVPGARIRAWSTAFPDQPLTEFPVDVASKAGDWADYVRGMTWALRDRGIDRGFDIRIESRVPLGSGLSSSASLLVATARALRAAFGLDLDDLEIALAARRAETDFVGAPVGVMDQMACSLGEEGSALLIDTRSLVFTALPLPASAALVVIDSGIRHSHASGEYRVRRDECRRAAEALGVRSLRDVSRADLPRVAALPPPLDRRVRHVITENDRVLAAVDALNGGTLARVGALFRASHASMRDDFDVSLPELDALVAVADRTPGVYGSRLTGGGFGGSIVALADRAAARAAAEAIVQQYNAQHPLVPARIVVPAT